MATDGHSSLPLSAIDRHGVQLIAIRCRCHRLPQVRRFWLQEVARVLRYEVPRPRSRLHTHRRPPGEAADDSSVCLPSDYNLLGLPMSPPPTEACVAAAFRAQAMRWHPDLAAAEDHAACTARFQRIVKAHLKLRHLAKLRRHLVHRG